MIIFRVMKELFSINKEQDQNYRFVVKNEVGEFLFNSIPFSNKKDVKTTIAQIQSSNSNAFIFERKTNYEGKFHFNLKTNDRRILGNSGLFQSKAGMENGIKQMKNHLSNLSSSI